MDLRRDSLFLAEFLLQQYHFPLPSIAPLLDPMRAKSTSVLELGAGTGLSSILLHGIFGQWTATDQYDNLKLISRNLRENGLEDVVRVKEVDWFRSLDKPTTTVRSGSDGEGLGGEEGYDLVLAIDCIYNEALIKPLVATFDRYAMKGRTLVWVVIELRSSDVVSSVHLLLLDTAVRLTHNSSSYHNIRCQYYDRSRLFWKNG